MTTSLRTELPRNANQLTICNSNIRSPEQADIVTLAAIMELSKTRTQPAQKPVLSMTRAKA
jgi:hypothetical protein